MPNTFFGKQRKYAPKEIPKEDKSEYRQFFLRSDTAQTRVVLILFTIAIAVFGISDYPLLGLSLPFYLTEFLRLLLVIYSILIVWKLKTKKTYRSYDNALFLYLLVYIVFSLFVNTTRIEGYAIQAVILGISVFAFYLALPTKFLNQVVLSSAYTVGESVLLFLLIPGQDQPLVIPILVVLFFANLIAALASWEFNYYRWLVFKDLSRLKKSERFVVIGQTAGMVGHDIRNPLQAITSDLYLIQEELNNKPQCSSSDIGESIQAINENISYINKIVSDLQDYTRSLKANPTPINIKGIFRNVATAVPRNITTRLVAEEGLTVTTDGTYLKRILTNLVTNAVQAMPNGGLLTLEAKAAGEKMQINVTDTGAGIPPEIAANLFTPLFTTKAKGQGLGLAVVKRLVEALNGSVSFESKPGEGTKFTIELPVS